MVSEDVIVKNEFLNDGKSIHIYSSRKFNGFVAFGFSAFLAMRTLKAKDITLQQRYSVVSRCRWWSSAKCKWKICYVMQ